MSMTFDDDPMMDKFRSITGGFNDLKELDETDEIEQPKAAFD